MLLTIIFKKYLDKNYFWSKRIFYFQFLISFLFYILYPMREYFILSILLIVSIIDIKEYIIPNFLIISLLLINILESKELAFQIDIMSTILLFILFILSIFDLGIGMGDVKLLFAVLTLNGGEFFMSLILALSLLIFFMGLYFILMKKEKNYKFPLGPFILLSYLLI